MAQKDRRIKPRNTYLKPIQYEVSTPMRDQEVLDAELFDISAGGACIITGEAYEKGTVVNLKLPLQGTDMMIPSLAEVRWTGPTDSKFKTGLQFLI
jgi:c-di-GMP-binding flagellar brake protein YcgR